MRVPLLSALHVPLTLLFFREDDSRWALEVSKIPALTAEFEKTSGRPHLLSASGGTPVRMTRVRDDIKVAYPNAKNVADRWSGSDHPAFSNVQMGDCHLSGVLVLVSDKLYLLEENKKVIVQQFDLQHLWLTPLNKNNLDWIVLTPNHSVFISFTAPKDAEIIFGIVRATQELLASTDHLAHLKIQVANRARSLFKSENAFNVPLPLVQSALVRGTSFNPSSTALQSLDRDSSVQTAKKWWDALYAPTRFVVFLYTMGYSTGDVYIGNMTCGVRSGWGVFLCHTLQRMYSCFWRHDRPYGFGRVRECNATGCDVSFCGFFDAGQFGPAVPTNATSVLPTVIKPQSPTLGYLVKKVTSPLNAPVLIPPPTILFALLPLHLYPRCAHVTHFSQGADSSFTYVGEFVGGKRSGQGTNMCTDGKYKGSWHQDARHGQGVLFQNVNSDFRLYSLCIC